MAITTRKPEKKLGTIAGREVLKLTSRLVKRSVSEKLSGPRDALASLPRDALASLTDRAGANAGDGGVRLAQRVRSIPIQRSIDIAVPLPVAYAEWMKLDFIPEGVHTVGAVRRRGDRLQGRIPAAGRQHSRWRAEVKEERPEESFAWRSVAGSDCLGLVTFHSLAERLTRLEVELDVIPTRASEAFELLTHIADRRAEADLRRFKAELERISPDDYVSLVDHSGDESQSNNHEEE